MHIIRIEYCEKEYTKMFFKPSLNGEGCFLPRVIQCFHNKALYIFFYILVLFDKTFLPLWKNMMDMYYGAMC